MKVKVSYTVDFDDIPKLIDDLMASCRQRFNKNANLKFNINKLDEFAHLIDQMRQDLSLMDSQLEDCLSLAAGYNNVENQVEEAPLEFDLDNEEKPQEG
tara:strand:+ start:359 stop:655 length:297 start_codon:yes stop_codon:yes gene_type:complete